MRSLHQTVDKVLGTRLPDSTSQWAIGVMYSLSYISAGLKNRAGLELQIDDKGLMSAAAVVGGVQVPKGWGRAQRPSRFLGKYPGLLCASRTRRYLRHLREAAGGPALVNVNTPALDPAIYFARASEEFIMGKPEDMQCLVELLTRHTKGSTLTHTIERGGKAMRRAYADIYSCMSGKDLSWFSGNEAAVGIIVVKAGLEVRGRALLWQTNDGQLATDRVWPGDNGPQYDYLQRLAKKEGWLFRTGTSYSDFQYVGPDGRAHLDPVSVTMRRIRGSHPPYMDSLKYFTRHPTDAEKVLVFASVHDAVAATHGDTHSIVAAVRPYGDGAPFSLDEREEFQVRCQKCGIYRQNGGFHTRCRACRTGKRATFL